MKLSASMKRESSYRTEKQSGANSVCFVLFLCFFFVETTALAQQRISGAVTNKTTVAPVSGATVKIESDMLATALTTKSDVEGRFSFVNLSPGRYDISVTAETFQQQRATITLGPRGTRQIDFELIPVATIKEQIVVNARAKLMDEFESETRMWPKSRIRSGSFLFMGLSLPAGCAWLCGPPECVNNAYV